MKKAIMLAGFAALLASPASSSPPPACDRPVDPRRHPRHDRRQRHRHHGSIQHEREYVAADRANRPPGPGEHEGELPHLKQRQAHRQWNDAPVAEYPAQGALSSGAVRDVRLRCDSPAGRSPSGRTPRRPGRTVLRFARPFPQTQPAPRERSRPGALYPGVPRAPRVGRRASAYSGRRTEKGTAKRTRCSLKTACENADGSTPEGSPRRLQAL